MMKKSCFFLGLLLFVPILSAQQPLAQEILDRIDKNMTYASARAEMEMIITVGNRVISKTFVSHSRGSGRALLEFLSPPRDRGVKILKIEDVIKIYYPSAERVMRLSGHMLRQSMMGSDFSFEDMTERSRKLREDYDAEVTGEETVGGRPCFVLTLTAKAEKQTYFTRKAWVDRERFIGLKEEMFARSGKRLKVMEVEEVRSLDHRFYPVRVVLQDMLREKSKTELVIKKIEFDIPIPDDMFSERQLMKK